MFIIWKYIQLHRNYTNAIAKAFPKKAYLQPFGISNGGTLEINYNGDNIFGILMYSSRYNSKLDPVKLCNGDLSNYSDYKIINSLNQNLVIQYNKSMTVTPMIFNCHQEPISVSYRYTNPINVDNNLLKIPFYLFPFLTVYAILACYYSIHINYKEIPMSAFIKFLSLMFYSIIWSRSWTVESYCKYFEHIYPIGNAIGLYLFIISLSERYYAIRYDDCLIKTNHVIMFILCIVNSYIFYNSMTAQYKWWYQLLIICVLLVHLQFVHLYSLLVSDIIVIQVFYMIVSSTLFLKVPANHFIFRLVIYEVMNLLWHICFLNNFQGFTRDGDLDIYINEL